MSIITIYNTLLSLISYLRLHLTIKAIYIILFSFFATLFNIQEVNAQPKDVVKASLVSLAQVKSEQVKPVMWLPGNVISRNTATISAEQSGQLLWIADIGDKVNKGDVIARIDNQELELQLAQLKAEMLQLQANVEYLQKQKQRMLTLAQKMSTSRSEVDRTDRDLAVGESQLDVLKLRVKQTELYVLQTIIVAPFDGEVSQRFSQTGELVDNRTTLLQLTDIHALDIQVAAPLDIASFIQDDTLVLVKWRDNIVSLPIRTWSSAGNQSSRTFDIRLDASDIALFPGSAVTVSLPRNNEAIATLVPRDALILREDEISVLKVGVDNVVQKILVQVGLGMDDWISVVGNIAALDQVVIRGGEDLSSGEKVRVN
jgi:RND family efflux transporter MFP subunit